jgi:hypothetical protein
MARILFCTVYSRIQSPAITVFIAHSEKRANGDRGRVVGAYLSRIPENEKGSEKHTNYENYPNQRAVFSKIHVRNVLLYTQLTHQRRRIAGPLSISAAYLIFARVTSPKALTEK